VARWEGYLAEDRATAMEKIGDGYLTVQHRDHPEKAAPSPRWARTSPALAARRHAVTEGAAARWQCWSS
jgi:TetR/AcrR family transcriptional repressor of nem operon